MDKLGLKDLSRANQLDCIISYLFQLHLMLHTCVQKFDVTDTVRKFLGTKQGFSVTAMPAFFQWQSSRIGPSILIEGLVYSSAFR